MSYRLKIDEKSLKSARFISRLQKKIQKALSDSGMTQQQVAKKIDVDRSVINRRLKGKTNLTARSIAEFAYAFNKDVFIDFVDKAQTAEGNWSADTRLVLDFPPQNVSKAEGTIESANDFMFERIASL